MKKTLTVNVGGTVYHIDEDAYRLLDNYLTNLKHYFKKTEGAEEIVNDIEQRISELFAEKMTDGSMVITMPDVEEVIARLGNPEEMEGEKSEAVGGDEADACDAEAASECTAASGARSVPRRFYRDPDDRMLGGVAGGIAAYFGWDATLIRLSLLVFLVFGFQVLIPIYIVCWLVVPEARTAAERLSMRGEEVTMENIGKTVTDHFEKSDSSSFKSDRPRTKMGELASFLVQGIGWFLRFCILFLALCCSPFLFAFAVVLLALIVAAVALLFDGGTVLLNLFPMFTLPESPLTTILMYISGILALGVPLLVVVHAVFSPMFHWQPLSTGLRRFLLVLWLIGGLAFLCFFFMFRGQIPDLLIATQYI